MQLLAELGSGDLLSSGLFPGLHQSAPPMWKDGENITFDNEGVRKSDGLLGLENLSVQPTGIKSTVAETEPRTFIGGGTKAYRYRASDGLTEIGTFSTSGGIYQFLPWDTWCLISNGSDPVELWQNTGSSAAITAPFSRANTLFGYQLQAFVGGTDNGGRLVEWSPVNAVTDWSVTAGGTAGYLLLRALAGDIVCAKPIGDFIGIYSQSNAGLFAFIGGTAIYGFRRPIRGVGAISPYSVVEVGDRHYGLTRENVFITDLVSFQLIDEPAVRNYIRDNADWDRMTEVYGWADYANSVVRWAVPKLGGGVFGIGFRWDKGTWTKFNDGLILGEEGGVFLSALGCKTNRFLRLDPSTGNNDGSAMTAYVQSRPLDLGMPNHFKRISMIMLHAEWSGDVKFRLGTSDHPNETVTWSDYFDMANIIYPDQLGLKSETVHMSMEIRSTASGATWNLAGGKVFGEKGGLYVS